jgi:hypothetical protein
MTKKLIAGSLVALGVLAGSYKAAHAGVYGWQFKEWSKVKLSTFIAASKHNCEKAGFKFSLLGVEKAKNSDGTYSGVILTDCE